MSKTIKPLELLERLSIFSPVVNEKIIHSILKSICDELQKDQKFIELEDLVTNSWKTHDVDCIEKAISELHEHAETLLDNVICVEVTVQSLKSISREPGFFFIKEKIEVELHESESVLVQGSIRELDTVKQIIVDNYTHNLSGSKLKIKS